MAENETELRALGQLVTDYQRAVHRIHDLQVEMNLAREYAVALTKKLRDAGIPVREEFNF